MRRASFCFSAAALGLQPPLPRCPRSAWWPGAAAAARKHVDQLDETLDRVAAVRFLGAAPARVDRQEAVIAHFLPRQTDQPLAYLLRQRGGAADVEPQPNRGRHFIDVLAARPAVRMKSKSISPSSIVTSRLIRIIEWRPARSPLTRPAADLSPAGRGEEDRVIHVKRVGHGHYDSIAPRPTGRGMSCPQGVDP